MSALMISKFLFLLTLTLLALNYNVAEGAIPMKTQYEINRVNRDGPYIGLVTGSQLELNLLLQHPSFIPDNNIIDFAGKRFRFGRIWEERVVVVMTGSSLINAGTTTELLVSLFRLKGVVHYGIATSGDFSFSVGYVTIPRFWSHSGLWSWQRFGSGPEDKLPLEGSGDYSRQLGYLKFADFAMNVSGCSNPDNLLNNIWYQQEEVYSTPEKRRHIFWVPVNAKYYNISRELEGLKLDNCANDICTLQFPKVSRVRRGTSASIFLDNSAYAQFLAKKFRVVPIDMESAAAALICHQQQVPFIAIKSLTGWAGSTSANLEIFGIPLAAKNAVRATTEFIRLLRQYNVSEPVFDM